jgi:hypothetical protein
MCRAGTKEISPAAEAMAAAAEPAVEAITFSRLENV